MHRLLARDERGYTLLEGLWHLIIFSLLMQLFILFFFWKEPMERYYLADGNTEWELFAVDLQKELVDVHSFLIINNSQGIQVLNDLDILINIEQSNQVIRKRVDGKGHVPILTGIKKVLFEENGNQLHVEVTMLNGMRKERSFAIGYHP